MEARMKFKQRLLLTIASFTLKLLLTFWCPENILLLLYQQLSDLRR